MERLTKAELEQEPIGIVISSGSRAEAQPRFTAYEWWPGPEEPEPVVPAGATRAA